MCSWQLQLPLSFVVAVSHEVNTVRHLVITLWTLVHGPSRRCSSHSIRALESGVLSMVQVLALPLFIGLFASRTNRPSSSLVAKDCGSKKLIPIEAVRRELGSGVAHIRPRPTKISELESKIMSMLSPLYILFFGLQQISRSTLVRQALFPRPVPFFVCFRTLPAHIYTKLIGFK